MRGGFPTSRCQYDIYLFQISASGVCLQTQRDYHTYMKLQILLELSEIGDSMRGIPILADILFTVLNHFPDILENFIGSQADQRTGFESLNCF